MPVWMHPKSNLAATIITLQTPAGSTIIRKPRRLHLRTAAAPTLGGLAAGDQHFAVCAGHLKSPSVLADLLLTGLRGLLRLQS